LRIIIQVLAGSHIKSLHELILQNKYLCFIQFLFFCLITSFTAHQ